MRFLNALRRANVTRNDEWEMPNNPFSLTFWANELAGEAGEACNILKKLERERLGAVGSRAPLSALAEELADVIICCDLIGMHQKIEIGVWPRSPVLDDHGSVINYSLWGVKIDARVGRVSMLSMHPEGEAPRRLLLPSALNDTVHTVKTLADLINIDLEKVIVTKFNMTSDKYGLKTKLEW